MEGQHYDVLKDRLGQASVIVDFLLLGSAANVKDHHEMAASNVGYVLNTADEIVHNLLPHAKYEKIKVIDQMFGTEHQHDTFHRAHAFLHEAEQHYRRDGTRCIVHCMRGRSRSATVVITYLMNYHKLSLRDAYHLVKVKRPAIGPHYDLRKQLVAYEREMHGTNTMDLNSFFEYGLPASN